MILRGKRIRKFAKHFGYLKDGQNVFLGVKRIPEHAVVLAKAGFPSTAVVNDAILPSTSCGPVARYNAEGKQIIRRDLPMETAFRQIYWTWHEWHGKDQIEKSDIKDVPYRRYPRDFAPPPSTELQLAQMSDGTELIICPLQKVNLADTSPLLHNVNLILELFGECHVFTENLDAIIQVPIKRLNWTILPQGTRPWPHLKSELKPLFDKLSKNKQQVVAHRFEHINSYHPDFLCTGTAGFHGYVIFGFIEKNLYLCESMYTGNATYVFANDWQSLSRLTKSEILSHNLQNDRIIHRNGWNTAISHLFR